MDDRGGSLDASQDGSVASDDTEPLADFGDANIGDKNETQSDSDDNNNDGMGGTDDPDHDATGDAKSQSDTEDPNDISNTTYDGETDEGDINPSYDDYLFDKNKDDPNIMKCMDCRIVFQKESKYKAHMIMHQQKKVYQCHLCSRCFSKSSNLSSHMLTHTGQKRFRCRLCLKMFPRMNNLRSHLMRMHRVARVQTDKLAERLDPTRLAEYAKSEPDRQSRETQLANLKLEVKAELGENNHGGDAVLDSNNPSIEDLKDNEDTDVIEFHGYYMKVNYFTKYHTQDAEKCTVTKKISYVCKHCGKEMNHKSNLIDHVRSHLGVKMYKCVICKKGLSRKQNLIHHLKYVHFIEDDELTTCIDKCTQDISSSDYIEGIGFPGVDAILSGENNENSESFLDTPGSFTADDSAIIETDESVENSLVATDHDTPEQVDAVKEDKKSFDISEVKEEQPDGNDDDKKEENQSVSMDTPEAKKKVTQYEEEDKGEEDPEDLPYIVIEGDTPEEKLYKCKQCDFACDRKYYMKTKHVLKHTGEKPYICVICARPYTRRYVLKNHVVAKHKLKGVELEKVIDASDLHLANDMKKLPMELGKLIDPLPLPNLENMKPYAEDKPKTKAKAPVDDDDEKLPKDVIKAEEEFAQNFVNHVLGVKVDPSGIADKSGDESLDASANDDEKEGGDNEDEPEYFRKNIEKNFSFTTITSPSTKGGYIFKCDLCGLTCTRKYYMVSQHKYKHMGAKPFMCIICCKPYSRKYVLRKHLFRDHSIKGKELETLMKATGKRVHPSMAGNNLYNRQKEVEIDLSDEREAYFRAKNIRRGFKRKVNEMDDSLASAAGGDDSKPDESVDSSRSSVEKPGTSGEKRAKRGTSSKTSKKKRKYHPFDKLIHEMINYDDASCRKCLRKFTKINNLQAHIRIQHFNLKPYNCDICNKLFTTCHNMKVHRETHFDRSKRTMSNFECQICSNIFSTKSYLKVHCVKAHNLKADDPRVKPKDKGNSTAGSSSVRNRGTGGADNKGEKSMSYVSEEDQSMSLDETMSMDETSQNEAEGMGDSDEDDGEMVDQEDEEEEEESSTDPE